MRKKRKEIRQVIRKMMQDKVMELEIKGESPKRYLRGQNLFLYLEIRDTSPGIRYIYDLSNPVFLGRNESKNQICIRDRMVSRYQGRIWSENGRVYYADEEDAANPVVIRRGLWSIKLRPEERICLKTGDCLVAGMVKIKIRLFAGEQEL